MFRYYFFLVFLLAFGCSKKRELTKDDLKRLNGNWMITKVIFPDGSEKKYQSSPNIDYIKIDGMTGIKKKLYPKYDGSLETNEAIEKFRIIDKVQKGFFISYDNGTMQWQEKINFLGDDFYSVKSKDEFIYCYKRVVQEKQD